MWQTRRVDRPEIFHRYTTPRHGAGDIKATSISANDNARDVANVRRWRFGCQRHLVWWSTMGAFRSTVTDGYSSGGEIAKLRRDLL